MRLFSLIYQGDVHPTTEEKVIPAEEFSTLMEASALLDKAKEDAKNYLEETQQKAIEIKETAKEEGFQKRLRTVQRASAYL